MSEKSQTALHSAPLPHATCFKSGNPPNAVAPNLGGSELSKSPRMGDLGGECRVMETSQTFSKAMTFDATESHRSALISQPDHRPWHLAFSLPAR
jgi:hypothetical protein